jgi:hypothetical protein
MLLKFTRHTLEETEFGYNVTLYMDNPSEEFSKEFGYEDTPKGNDILNKSIMEYIKEHLPNIKINMIKVMIGSVMVFTISMAALESSLKVTQAAVVYSDYQIQKALDNTTANIVLDKAILELPQRPFIIEGVTYVPIREVCEKLGFNVSWNNQNVVVINKGDTYLEFKVGAQECLFNGKTKTMPYTMVVNGKTMIPLRFLGEIFGLKVSWEDTLKTVVISSTGDTPTRMEIETIVAKQNNYSQEDLYWLSRIVSAEAGGESYEGKLAVANCILNRVKNKEFPDTIKDVIFDTQYAVQYEPTINGEIYRQPTNESTQAAIDALNGKDNSQGALYFMNVKQSTSNWIIKNRNYAFAIGKHNFYF